ncbi:PP2C family protein-serine/threonine phosphatase [Micromonospora maritima]|uniref:PP2C family protein-serine/threonine phosphatase n=1 Tax=Micromonospora maritima TaxID=986711 RepID=UPI00379BA8AB
MLAELALGAYRNARRAGADLTEIYHHIDQAVRPHDRQGTHRRSAGRARPAPGRLRVISAGHPSGLIIRDGRIATVLPTPTALPVSMGGFRPPVVVEEALEPGDHVLLHTAGVTEARSSRGEAFGVDRLTEFTLRALARRASLPETTRQLGA